MDHIIQKSDFIGNFCKEDRIEFQGGTYYGGNAGGYYQGQGMQNGVAQENLTLSQINSYRKYQGNLDYGLETPADVEYGKLRQVFLKRFGYWNDPKTKWNIIKDKSSNDNRYWIVSTGINNRAINFMLCYEWINGTEYLVKLRKFVPDPEYTWNVVKHGSQNIYFIRTPNTHQIPMKYLYVDSANSGALSNSLNNYWWEIVTYGNSSNSNGWSNVDIRTTSDHFSNNNGKTALYVGCYNTPGGVYDIPLVYSDDDGIQININFTKATLIGGNLSNNYRVNVNIAGQSHLKQISNITNINSSSSSGTILINRNQLPSVGYKTANVTSIVYNQNISNVNLSTADKTTTANLSESFYLSNKKNDISGSTHYFIDIFLDTKKSLIYGLTDETDEGNITNVTSGSHRNKLYKKHYNNLNNLYGDWVLHKIMPWSTKKVQMTSSAYFLSNNNIYAFANHLKLTVNGSLDSDEIIVDFCARTADKYYIFFYTTKNNVYMLYIPQKRYVKLTELNRPRGGGLSSYFYLNSYTITNIVSDVTRLTAYWKYYIFTLYITYESYFYSYTFMTSNYPGFNYLTPFNNTVSYISSKINSLCNSPAGGSFYTLQKGGKIKTIADCTFEEFSTKSYTGEIDNSQNFNLKKIIGGTSKYDVFGLTHDGVICIINKFPDGETLQIHDETGYLKILRP
jgi:hypothetical protein